MQRRKTETDPKLPPPWAGRLRSDIRGRDTVHDLTQEAIRCNKSCFCGVIFVDPQDETDIGYVFFDHPTTARNSTIGAGCMNPRTGRGDRVIFLIMGSGYALQKYNELAANVGRELRWTSQYVLPLPEQVLWVYQKLTRPKTPYCAGLIFTDRGVYTFRLSAKLRQEITLYLQNGGSNLDRINEKGAMIQRSYALLISSEQPTPRECCKQVSLHGLEMKFLDNNALVKNGVSFIPSARRMSGDDGSSMHSGYSGYSGYSDAYGDQSEHVVGFGVAPLPPTLFHTSDAFGGGGGCSGVGSSDASAIGMGDEGGGYHLPLPPPLLHCASSSSSGVAPFGGSGGVGVLTTQALEAHNRARTRNDASQPTHQTLQLPPPPIKVPPLHHWVDDDDGASGSERSGSRSGSESDDSQSQTETCSTGSETSRHSQRSRFSLAESVLSGCDPSREWRRQRPPADRRMRFVTIDNLPAECTDADIREDEDEFADSVVRAVRSGRHGMYCPQWHTVYRLLRRQSEFSSLNKETVKFFVGLYFDLVRAMKGEDKALLRDMVVLDDELSKRE